MDNFKNELEEKEKDLSNLLHTSDIHPSSPDFAQRIIHAAARTPQKTNLSIQDYIQELLQDLFDPKVALTFASILLIGLLTGLTHPLGISKDSIELSSYLYDEGTSL